MKAEQILENKINSQRLLNVAQYNYAVIQINVAKTSHDIFFIILLTLLEILLYTSNLTITYISQKLYDLHNSHSWCNCSIVVYLNFSD